MKAIEEINAEWNAGGVAAIAAIDALLPHFARDGVEATLARVDPILRERVTRFARNQDYEKLLEDARVLGHDPTPWIALRDWVAALAAPERAK